MQSLFSGSFYDFDCVPNDRTIDRYQYISPNLSFPCAGVVTKWKFGTINVENAEAYLQIWRPDGTDYSRVTETLYTHIGGTIAEVSTDMTVSARDVIGFFTPRVDLNVLGLRVALAQFSDHTLLQGPRSASDALPEARFSDIRSTLSSSPLVSVAFGKYGDVIL